MSENKGMFSESEPWSRLDNAAKLFPSTTKKSDTRVFRFSCDLDHEVDKEILQQAADMTADDFPGYMCVIQSGFFWYYLEHCDLRPVVTEEDKPVCAELYAPERHGLLFRISYHRNSVNFEVFHALTDGNGALRFFKALIYNYLLLKFPEEYKEPPKETVDASKSQKSDDSFRRYYDPKAIKKVKEKKRRRKAYHLTGEPTREYRLQVIEGICSVKSVHDMAKRYNTTITVLLTALFMQAIRKEMPLSGLKHPMVINVPVDLRHYFPSETAKNFFSTIGVEYDFKARSGELSDIISEVDKGFKSELTEEKLAARMNRMASLEHNAAARIAPLPLKNFVLRCARSIKDDYETAVVSNIGRITMPAEMERHLVRFGILISTMKLQMCICSFGDNLQIGFTSGFTGTDIQRDFFRSLSEMGIGVEIRANDFFS